MDDELLFEDETPVGLGLRTQPWRVMIVDDEVSVHQVTQLVMSDFELDGRGLQFSSCYSAEEARRALAEQTDVALILLDVVMESEHAGLDLARYIRDDLKNTNVRIVLRTGQPGRAPLEDVICNYDINDYREKTDLTHGKLITVFCSALRAYRDLMRLERARTGLRRSIEAITAVCDSDNLRVFCSAVLEQVGVLLGREGEGVCASRVDSSYAATNCAATGGGGQLKVLAVTAAYAALRPDTALEDLPAPVRQALERSMRECASHYGERHYVCYHRTRDGNESFLYMAFADPIEQDERELLDAFGANVAITYEKLVQREEVEQTQASTIETLGEAMERHSGAAGMHVRRVGEIAALLGEAMGLAPYAVSQLRHAAALHDVGHIGVADTLLNAPGALDPAQWQSMREHTRIGYEMLVRSGRPVLQLAARIAYEHHEHWDGGGYPCGLAGPGICIEARITALADVLDALVCARPYRPAWSLDEALAYVRAGSGKQFDPELVTSLLARVEQLQVLYRDYPSV